MKEARDLRPPDPSSARRRRPFHLGLLLWDGFVYPELYIDPTRRASLVAGRLVLLLCLPLVIPYLALQRMFLWLARDGYRGAQAAFRHSAGPIPFAHVAAERLGIAAARRRASGQWAVDTGARVLRADDPWPVLVIDDFYPDPHLVREHLMQATMQRYEKGWFTTALGDVREHALAREAARCALQVELGLELDAETFDSDCDGRIFGWNGALHLKLSENWLATDACCIHNHADLPPGAWTGVVFLDPEPPTGATGTELLRRMSTGRCLEPTKCYDARVFQFEPICRVAPVFNRAVLFPATALHRGDAGHGFDRQTARAFQTLFFTVGDA